MRKRTKPKSKSIKSPVSDAKRQLKRVQRYTQLSLKGDVVGYFGSPLFREDLASVSPKDRIRVFIDLLQYVFPKLQATALADFSSSDPATREGVGRLLELSKRFMGADAGKPAVPGTPALDYAELVE